MAAAALLSACGGGDPGVSVFDYVAKQQGQTPRLVGTESAPVVRYEVSGASASAQISYTDEKNIDRKVEVLLPWKVEFHGTKNQVLWLFAMADAQASGIEIAIVINEVVKVQEQDVGPLAIASGLIFCC